MNILHDKEVSRVHYLYIFVLEVNYSFKIMFHEDILYRKCIKS